MDNLDVMKLMFERVHSQGGANTQKLSVIERRMESFPGLVSDGYMEIKAGALRSNCSFLLRNCHQGLVPVMCSCCDDLAELSPSTE